MNLVRGSTPWHWMSLKALSMQLSTSKEGLLFSESALCFKCRCFHTSYGMPSGPAADPNFDPFRALVRSAYSVSEFSGEVDGSSSFWLLGMALRAFSIASCRLILVSGRRSSNCRFSW